MKKIHRLLFHVIAHLYHSHFRELVLLSLHAHLNCIFAHFTLFNERFRLIEEKETEILHDLVLALRLHPEGGGREAANSEAQQSEAQETIRQLAAEAAAGGTASCLSTTNTPTTTTTTALNSSSSSHQSGAFISPDLTRT